MQLLFGGKIPERVSYYYTHPGSTMNGSPRQAARKVFAASTTSIENPLDSTVPSRQDRQDIRARRDKRVFDPQTTLYISSRTQICIAKGVVVVRSFD
jgi:hypothetical protein